jgi:uncharacterized MAPEG superfamily protein
MFPRLPQGHTDMLAMAFVALRMLFVAVYLLNIGVVCSLVWAAAAACSIGTVLPLLTFSA